MALMQQVGQAVIKLVYDDKDLEKQGNQVSLKLGAKLKTAAAAGAAAIVSGVTIATKAVGELAKEATRAYGEFEQLEGGMQKIFDEVDYNVIKKDALNAWQDLNVSAAEYMENITGIGATFAQTMGDQKGYDMARKGMKAIADYSSGTGKNIDELMGKFQLITRSATSYLSIADQFAGILPQTTDGFIEQAYAAGYLSENYEKLKDIPVEEYQEAVTKMVEKGVKDMGLLGNTAAETSKTLTGSLAGFKSTLKNLVTGLADPQADIEELVATTVRAGADLAKNFSTIFTRALKGAVTALREIIPKALPLLTQMIAEIAPMLIEAGIDTFNEIVKYLPQMLEILLGVANTLILKIADKLPELMQILTKALVQAIEILTRPENLLLIIKAAITLFMAIVEAIPEIIEALTEALPDIIDNIIDFLTDPESLIMIGEATLTLFGAMVAAIPRILGALVNAFKRIFENLWERLEGPVTEGGEKVGGFFSSVGEAVGNFFKGIGDWIVNTFNAVVEKAKQIGLAVLEFFKPMTDFFVNLGTVVIAIAATIAEGIYNILIKPITDFVVGLVNAIKELVTGLATWITDHIVMPFIEFMTGVFNWIGNKAQEIGSWIANTAKGIGEAIVNAFKAAGNWLYEHFIKPVGSFFSHLWDGIKNGVKGIGEFIKNIFTTVGGWIKAPINGIIGGINGVIDTINGIKVPDWVPGLGGAHANFAHIPKLAQGGVANSSTMALIGESGREAVIPLEQNTGNWAGLLAGKLAEEFKEQGGTPGSSITVYMTNNINSELDIDKVQQELTTAIRRAA